MKLLVIGLGSMGKRRIALLSDHFPDISVCGVDINIDRRMQAEELFLIKTYADLDEAIGAEKPEKPDAAFVCTSPESHGNLILTCLREGLDIFSEINLLRDQYEEILSKGREKGRKLFLSSTLLYRREIEIIREMIQKQNSKVNYRYHVGQYLPDWHPWEKDGKFFVWNKKTNGCREIFAIDLPWIIKVFGKVKKITAIKDNLSTLEIQYPDNYFVILEHENGTKGVFVADIVARKAVRELLIYSEGLHLMWDGTPSGLCQYNIEKKVIEKIETYREIQRNQNYADHVIENAYLDELHVFLEKITEKQNRERYTFEDDMETLRLIDRIEGFES